MIPFGIMKNHKHSVYQQVTQWATFRPKAARKRYEVESKDPPPEGAAASGGGG